MELNKVAINKGYRDPDGVEAPPSGTMLAPLVRRAAEIFSQARAANTVRAYGADWRDFTGWCAGHGFLPLPAEPRAVVLYLAARSETDKVSTLQRRLAAIAQAHHAAALESPTPRSPVRLFMAGLRRERGSEPAAKRPILARELQAMLQTVPDSVLGTRDRALLLVGFLGAFRRSELVALDADDIEEAGEGLIVRVRRSKTDPEGRGARKGIPRGSGETCPVAALHQWMEIAAIAAGPVFRPVNRHGGILPCRLSGEAVALVVKRYARAAGLDPAQVAGHSLRAGLATSAAQAGKSERAIMRQTLHRSVTTLRRYIREGGLFRDNAAGGLGL